MGAIKITRKILDSIELRDKPYDIWDTEVKGLIVTIFPSGRKTFSFRYYDHNKKKQKLKIGIFGNITCEVAREKAKKISGDLAHDIDPKKAKQKVSFSSVVLQNNGKKYIDAEFSIKSTLMY